MSNDGKSILGNIMKTNSEYVDAWIKRNSSPNGVVYKIVNVVTGDEYIGKTTLPLKRCWYKHVTMANMDKGGLLYESIRAWGKECFDIKIVHSCSPDEDYSVVCKKLIYDTSPSLNKLHKNIY